MKKITNLLWSIPFLFPALTYAQITAGTSDVTGKGLDLCPPGSSFDNLCGNVGIGPVIGTIIQFIFVVAIVIALVFLVYGGLKWIVSGGDKGKVEEARGTIIAAIIGLVVVFLSYLILSFVLSLFGLNLTTLEIPSISLIKPE